MGKVISIAEKKPVASTLPDGSYSGIWGGYIIEFNYDGKTYELTTDEGVRGMGFRVIVNIKDGIGTFNDLKN